MVREAAQGLPAPVVVLALLAGCGTSGPPHEASLTDSTPTARPVWKPPPAVAESPESALRRRASEAYALYSERQFLTFHEEYASPRYRRECVAGDRALLTNAPP